MGMSSRTNQLAIGTVGYAGSDTCPGQQIIAGN
jgi:hypothetical protein